MLDFKIKIARKIIRFKCDDPGVAYNASQEREFKGFVYTGEDGEDVVLDIKYGAMPDFSGRQVLFSVDKSWNLSRYRESILFEYPDRSLDGRTERAAELNKELTRGNIYINKPRTPEEEARAAIQRAAQGTDERMKAFRAARQIPGQGQAVRVAVQDKPKDAKPREKAPEELGKSAMSELKANFFQAFLVEFLIHKKVGFLAHCSSVYSDGRLYLFMGQSQAGKSTIADIWHELAGATVFNDDRAVLTVEKNVPYFYNAPWAGTLFAKCRLGEGDGTKLGGIFFLYQSKANSARKLGKVEAAAKIFKNSFPVFWEEHALNYVIGICSDIAASVPCYDLEFVNDESVVGFIKKEAI